MEKGRFIDLYQKLQPKSTNLRYIYRINQNLNPNSNRNRRDDISDG